MRRWLAGEPSLEELLGDDIMGPVVASAGMSREQFRLRLAELASRLGNSEGVTCCGGDGARRVAIGC